MAPEESRVDPTGKSATGTSFFAALAGTSLPRCVAKTAAAVLFAFYAGTGQVKYKRAGLVTLKWTIIAALGFFGVLILERVF